MRKNIFATLPQNWDDHDMMIFCFYGPFACSSAVLDYSGYVTVVRFVCLHTESVVWCQQSSNLIYLLWICVDGENQKWK